MWSVTGSIGDFSQQFKSLQLAWKTNHNADLTSLYWIVFPLLLWKKRRKMQSRLKCNQECKKCLSARISSTNVYFTILTFREVRLKGFWPMVFFENPSTQNVYYWQYDLASVQVWKSLARCHACMVNLLSNEVRTVYDVPVVQDFHFESSSSPPENSNIPLPFNPYIQSMQKLGFLAYKQDSMRLGTH